ncbi:UDP-glucose 4-epimerase GalE [Enterobacter sp.]|uniref:UDP-glucose 4-epimerase GalE n=1 Tax=Enterobacter sp. TaxID=42895 RepID=UPI00296F1B8B|nr:UDP-glucose 4-epimerase GalE [Enterobacter sp.]
MALLITGGLGYIGSHTIVELLKHDYEIVIIDNLSNSKKNILNKIETISDKKCHFYSADIRNIDALDSIFSQHSFTDIIHFAGLKSVNESILNPLKYYDNNVIGSLNLLNVMVKHNVHNFIFSSSATVYGSPCEIPLKETSHTGGTTNPYGASKYITECMLRDLAQSDPSWNISVLRYFNPVGAHPSGLLGEQPVGVPNNLVPYITEVAAGLRKNLNVYGCDYDTKDGSGVRDFIHVNDLASGHLAALKSNKKNGFKVYNLGTGYAYSVLELIHTFERVNNIKIPYVIAERRAGDVAECWSDPSLAATELGWRAQYNLEDMLRDSWRWQRNILKTNNES